MHLAAKALLDETLVRYTVNSPPVNLLIRGNVWKNTGLHSFRSARGDGPSEAAGLSSSQRMENGKVKMENGQLWYSDRSWNSENGKWATLVQPPKLEE